MTIKDYLSHVPNDEIINRLKNIDQSLYELHQNGFYVVCNIADIDIINDEVTLASFKDKVDYLNSGYNNNGDKQDILELCSIGICAFNHFDKYYSSKEFIAYLIDNLDSFISNGKIPRIMQEYYIEIFARANVMYLNDYLLKNEYVNKELSDGSGKNKGIVKTKSTAVGRALAGNDKEAAYVKVLLLPSVIVLVYLLVLVMYFIFFR